MISSERGCEKQNSVEKRKTKRINFFIIKSPAIRRAVF